MELGHVLPTGILTSPILPYHQLVGRLGPGQIELLKTTSAIEQHETLVLQQRHNFDEPAATL
jgi:hypothetical protein